MSKQQLRTIDDFEREYGTETMDRVLMERLLVMGEESRRFRQVEQVVFSDGATLAKVRKVFEVEDGDVS